MQDIGVGVQWIAKCKYHVGQNVGEHSHWFFHYLYIIDGSGKIMIDGSKYIFEREHIYMVPIDVSHGFMIDDSRGLHAIEIKFDISDKRLFKDIKKLPHVMNLENTNIRNVLESMIVEGINKDIYFSNVINLKLYQILVRLLREQTPKRDKVINMVMDSKIHKSDDKFRKVIEYMRENIDTPIDLDTLANIACLEKSYFSKKFKDIFGSPPIKFLNEMRLEKARDLLKYSDMNITQISYATGFQSLHYFSRFFTQRERISPYEYRKKYRDNIFIFIDEKPNVAIP